LESQIHPRLRKDEEAGQEQPEAIVAPETESVAPQDEPEVAEQEEDESKYLVTFDRRKAGKAFEQWQKEDPELANSLNSWVGQKARREWKPKLDQVELELAEVRAQFHQAQMRTMTQEQVKDRLLNDPQFRQNFGQVPDPQALAQQKALERAIETSQEAVADVLAADELSGFRKSLEGGWYDFERDEAGKPLRALPVEESLARYNRDLMQAAMAKRQGAVAPPPTRPSGPPPPPTIAPPVAEKPKAAPNPKLAQVSPDLSPPSSGGTGATRMSLSEYKAMNWSQRMAMFPTNADYEKARKSGLIYGD